MEEVEPRWRAGEAQLLDNLGGELDPAEAVRRRCKKSSPSVLSCIGKRKREGFDRVGTTIRSLPIVWNYTSLIVNEIGFKIERKKF